MGTVVLLKDAVQLDLLDPVDAGRKANGFDVPALDPVPNRSIREFKGRGYFTDCQHGYTIINCVCLSK